jgi:hypothetical protein
MCLRSEWNTRSADQPKIAQSKDSSTEGRLGAGVGDHAIRGTGYHCGVLKLLVFSILVLTFVLPAVAAKIGNPRRALFSMLVWMALVEVGYAFFLHFIYFRFL